MATTYLTFDEKAKNTVDKMFSDAGLDVGATMHRKIEQIVALALKEQDRDTRYACAESMVVVENQRLDFDCDEAYDICMNTVGAKIQA